MPITQTQTAMIASGASLSGPIALNAKSLIGIAAPAAWTAAELTFQVSADDGATFQNLFNESGVEVALNFDAGRFVRLLPDEWTGFTHIKIRSGPASLPVNQAADRILTLRSREFA